jgi:hypothetical protein
VAIPSARTEQAQPCCSVIDLAIALIEELFRQGGPYISLWQTLALADRVRLDLRANEIADRPLVASGFLWSARP